MTVLKQKEAMFQAPLQAGDRVGMLATFVPAVPGMEAEFDALALAQRRPGAAIRTVCVPEAMAALRQGDADTHNALLAAAASRLNDCDVLLLAHFSTSRAFQAVAAATGRPVQTSPDAAVLKMRRLAGG